MLTEHEIYAIGKGTISEIRHQFLSEIRPDTIEHDPGKVIAVVNCWIQSLERFKSHLQAYKQNQAKEDRPEW